MKEGTNNEKVDQAQIILDRLSPSVFLSWSKLINLNFGSLFSILQASSE